MGILGKVFGAALIGAGAVASAIGSNKLTAKDEPEETTTKEETTKEETTKEETTKDQKE